jgi:hypothetical protein
MSKPLWLGLAIVLLSAAGCFTLPIEPFAPKTAPSPVRAAPKAIPPVTADQILPSGENAHEIYDNLDKELDRELNAP